MVNAVAISSTAVEVVWSDVPPVDQNGMIVQYEVEYTQSTLTGAPMLSNHTVDAFVFSLLLTGLEEYVEYAIRVRAYTTVGAGPYSAMVFATTHEDGNISSA